MAPLTVIETVLVDPSASAISCAASEPQISMRAASNSDSTSATPDAPLPIRSTVSLVDVQPSESMRLNVRSATRANISCASPGRTASVITTDNIVARAGASIPAPFATPAKSTPLIDEAATFGTLSVVMIARETSSSDSNFSAVAIDSRPEMILGIGKSSPISPVEHTTTSPDEILRSSPTFSAVWCVSANP